VAKVTVRLEKRLRRWDRKTSSYDNSFRTIFERPKRGKMLAEVKVPVQKPGFCGPYLGKIEIISKNSLVPKYEFAERFFFPLHTWDY